MPTIHRVAQVATCLSIALFAAASSALPQNRPPGDQESITPVLRPECPQHSFRPLVRVATPPRPASIPRELPSRGLIPDIPDISIVTLTQEFWAYGAPTIIPHVGPVTNIPEFHDCQQFIVRDNTGRRSFQHLIAIFATQDVPTQPSADSIYLVAVIYNYARSLYLPLNIAPDFNCVYLHLRDPNSGEAWITANGGSDACAARLSKAAAGTANLQRFTEPQPRNASDIPMVARWHHDYLLSQTYYMGVPCAGRWCSVGGAGFRPVPAHSMPADAAGGPNHRVYRVPGWHDEQELAVTLPNGELVPGEVRVTFYPAPDLEIHDKQPNPFANMEYVGTIVVRPVEAPTALTQYTLGKYWQKYRLRLGAPTHVYLKRLAGANVTWEIHFVRGPSSVSYPAHREDHTGKLLTNQRMPGTVRWRWLTTDETTWVRCLQGCCTPETPY